MGNIRSSRFFDLCWSFLATSHIATAQDQGGFGFTDNHYGLSDLEIQLGVNGSREFTEGLFARPDPKILVYQINISNFGQQTILDVVNEPIPIPYWNATINGAIYYLDNMFKKHSTTEYDPITEDGTPKSFCFKPKRSPTGPPRRGSDQCLYIHTSSLNNTVQFRVSCSQSLQEEEGYDPVEYYPLQMKWGDLREIVGALCNATVAPLESSFSVLSPFLRPDKPFASGCFERLCECRA